jgi:hypothetical protein
LGLNRARAFENIGDIHFIVQASEILEALEWADLGRVESATRTRDLEAFALDADVISSDIMTINAMSVFTGLF